MSRMSDLIPVLTIPETDEEKYIAYTRTLNKLTVVHELKRSNIKPEIIVELLGNRSSDERKQTKDAYVEIYHSSMRNESLNYVPEEYHQKINDMFSD